MEIGLEKSRERKRRKWWRSSRESVMTLNNNHTEEFLDCKSKKKWVDSESGHNCFMLYPRSLYLANNESQYWTWTCFKETSDENVEVVKLLTVCWLDVKGMLKISDLSPGVVYEIVWVVKLTNGASGWERPITLRLSLPGENPRERRFSLLDKPRGQWIELNAGSFIAKDGESGEVSANLLQTGGHWKNGLIFKGVITRPKKLD